MLNACSPSKPPKQSSLPSNSTPAGWLRATVPFAGRWIIGFTRLQLIIDHMLYEPPPHIQQATTHHRHVGRAGVSCSASSSPLGRPLASIKPLHGEQQERVVHESHDEVYETHQEQLLHPRSWCFAPPRTGIVSMSLQQVQYAKITTIFFGFHDLAFLAGSWRRNKGK